LLKEKKIVKEVGMLLYHCTYLVLLFVYVCVCTKYIRLVG